MRTGEVAKIIGVSTTTITNWTDQEDLAPFFSDPAKATDSESSQRDYSSDDVLVLNTIRLQKTRHNAWKDVAALLNTGHRETELPLSASLAKTMSPMDHMGQLILLRNERDVALAQLQDAQFEIERLRKELTEERQQAQKAMAEERHHLEEALKEEHEKSVSKLNELHKLVGRLETTVEMLQANLEQYEGENKGKK